YISWSHFLIRKAVIGMLILVAFMVMDGILGKSVATSFLPEEDYGYLLLNVQLPSAASLERTDLVCKKVEDILGHTEGVADYNTVAGFSLLTRVSASYNGFFFVALKPWDERGSGHLEARDILSTINGRLSREVPEATAFAFMPP